MNKKTSSDQFLIADSGSTKTDWALISEQGEVKYFKTGGLNPYFASEDEFNSILVKEVLPKINSSYTFGVYFYGAGCGNQKNRDWVKNIFLSRGAGFVEVDTDLLGSGRSVFQNGQGIIAILGTGANAGYYKNGVIDRFAPSMGYILGDEGSGVWTGKKMLTAYLRNELPENIAVEVKNLLRANNDTILNNIYKEPFPNRYIASVASILDDFKNEPWTILTMKEGFDLFFKNYIKPVTVREQKKICITGSVATMFSDILNEVTTVNGFQNLECQTSVIDGLAKYHQKK